MPSIVLAGHPCVGKTTFAHLLAKRALSRSTISNVVHISESTACPDQTKAECYSNSHMEKTTRAALKSEFDRAVVSSAANEEGSTTLVILDSLNYIKGYRYELFCISKAAGERHGVVWVMGSSSDEQFNSASTESSSDVLAKKRNQERKVMMQKQFGQQDDNEKKSKSENDLDGYYEDDETMNQLVLRFEPPDEKNRWENPLFKVDVTSVSPWDRNGTLEVSASCDQTTNAMKTMEINDTSKSNDAAAEEKVPPQPAKKKMGSGFKRNKKKLPTGGKTVTGTAPVIDNVKQPSSVEPAGRQSVPSSMAKRNLAAASALDDTAASSTSVATKETQTMEQVIDGILDSFFSQRALTEGMSTLHQFSAESNALNQVDNITHRMNSEILKAQKAASVSAGVGGKIFVALTPNGDRRPINLSKPLYMNELRNFRRQFLKWIAAHPLADGTKEDRIADVYISYVESQI